MMYHGLSKVYEEPDFARYISKQYQEKQQVEYYFGDRKAREYQELKKEILKKQRKKIKEKRKKREEEKKS